MDNDSLGMPRMTREWPSTGILLWITHAAGVVCRAYESWPSVSKIPLVMEIVRGCRRTKKNILRLTEQPKLLVRQRHDTQRYNPG